MTTEVTKHVNKNNSDHSILFEAINLSLTHEAIFADDLAKDTANLLSRFIAVKEPNIRYLALEFFARCR